ncbi:hypothetical protein Tco_1382122, partial [Tanacetum coccineum]
MGKVKESLILHTKGWSGPEWLVDIDTLTKLMNYKPVVAGNQSNGNAGEDEEKVTKEPGSGVQSKEGAKDDQEKEAEVDINSIYTASPSVNASGTKEFNANNTNNIYTVSTPVNAASSSFVNADAFPDDSLMPNLEDIDMIKIVHKDYPTEQIIRDLHYALKTRRMSRKNKAGLISSVHKEFQNCLFACFLSQIEPKKNCPPQPPLPPTSTHHNHHRHLPPPSLSSTTTITATHHNHCSHHTTTHRHHHVHPPPPPLPPPPPPSPLPPPLPPPSLPPTTTTATHHHHQRGHGGGNGGGGGWWCGGVVAVGVVVAAMAVVVVVVGGVVAWW